MVAHGHKTSPRRAGMVPATTVRQPCEQVESGWGVLAARAVGEVCRLKTGGLRAHPQIG